MNILERLAKENINYKIKYFGNEDIATSYEIKNFIENGKKIIEITKNINNEVLSVDDYVDYCYVAYVINFSSSINNVIEQYRAEFANFINSFKQINSKYKIGSIIKFVSINYKKIFEYKNENINIRHELNEFTANFIFRYIRKNIEIYEYLCKNYPHILMDNFGSIKEIFFEDDNLKLIDLLLSEENIKKLIAYRQDEIQNIIKKINDSNKACKEYKEVIERYIAITKKLYFGSNEDNVIQIYNQLSSSKDFVISMKEKAAYDYEIEFNRVENLMSDYLEKHGTKKEIEFDLSPWFNLIDNESIDITLRLLTLTETKDGKEYKSIFQKICSIESDFIINLVSSCSKTDDVFKNSTLFNLNMSMTYLERTINHIIRNKDRKIQYVQHIGGCYKNYLDRKEIVYNEDEITNDINMLMNGIDVMIDSFTEKNEYKSKYATFTLISFVSGLIEKYFRCMYKTLIKDSRYVDMAALRLKNILDDRQFEEYINKENSDCFEYYLLKRNGVGLNIRNIVDHYDDEVYEKLSYENVLLLLSLLLIVANRMLIIN